MAQVLNAVEEVFGTRLTPTALYQNPTLAGFAAVVRGSRRAGGRMSVVPVWSAGSGPPLFLISGGSPDPTTLSGLPGFVAPLARLLGPHQRVYTLGYECDPAEPNAPTIERIAADFVRGVRGVQPSGPYGLAGWSTGGLVAYEMARQLEAGGDVVGLVALFDTTGPDYPARRPWAARPRAVWRIWSGLSVSRRLAYPAVEVWWGARRVGAIFGRRLSRRAAAPNPWVRILAIEDAYLATRPGYPGRVVQFASRDTLASTSNLVRFVHDPTLGWGAVTSGVECRVVRGNHHSMFDEPGLSDIAAGLREKLAANPMTAT